MATIQQIIQQAQTDPIIDLYKLDLTILNGSIYYFTPMTAANGTTLVTGNRIWQAMPIMIENLSYSTIDAPAKPTLTVSNINKTLLWGVISLGDLVGATLTRWRTFSSLLTGTSSTTTSSLPNDKFFVEKKLVHNKMNIQWQLTSVIDKSGASIPKRIFLKKDFPGLSKYRI